jgi:hypothetical protein
VRTKFKSSFGVLLILLLTAGVSPQTFGQSPQAKLLQDAEKFASDLKKQDKLPGYSSTNHGRVTASAPWSGGSVSYPATVTVRATKDGDPSTFVYVLVRDSAQSAWRLTKATQLEKDGKVIAELFPK